MLFARIRSRWPGSWSREDVDPELLREYDAFGPWIYPVRSEPYMPRRFRPFYPRHASARFLFKLPAQIDRVTARPGQDLYRAVLAVHEDRLCFLELRGEGVVESEVEAPEVVAVRNHTCLLHGELAFDLADGRSIGLTYNTVSQERIEEVVDFVRAWIGPGAPAQRPPTPAIRDHWFRYLIADHARRSASSAFVYCEERGRVLRDPAGRRRRARGILALDTGAELTIITRGDFPYATDRAHLRHAALLGHALREEPRSRFRTHRVLRVALRGHDLVFELCGEGTTLLEHLERLEAGRRPGGDGPGGERVERPG